jgi:small subunit ribosomal protein S20
LANSRSSKKRARQAVKRADNNRGQRSRIKTGIKRVLTADSPEAAQSAFRDVAALLDRMATRRVIHPNKAARKKSQLARHIAASQ